MNRKSFRVIRAGERTNVDGKPVSNKVLLAMPDNEYQLMRPDLAYVDLPDRLSLHEATQAIEYVYFPKRGMVSQVVVTKDGRTVEVGVVGNEGYVGAGLAFGLSRSSVREIVQIAGDGFRIVGNELERVALPVTWVPGPNCTVCAFTRHLVPISRFPDEDEPRSAFCILTLSRE